MKFINTFKYHVFAPMGRFQLELIYLYFPEVTSTPTRPVDNVVNERSTENKGKLILTEIYTIYSVGKVSDLCENLVRKTRLLWFVRLLTLLISGDITKSLNQVRCSSRSVIFLTMKIRREH